MIPVCHGMPVEVLNGSASHCKTYGIRSRRTGIIVGIRVSEKDQAKIENSTEAELKLNDLPSKIILKMNGAMLKQYPGLPEGHFPMLPTN
eukprot:7183333-Karenia_brevis.AAC.1